MTNLFQACLSIARTAAIQQGAKIERTNEEIIQGLLFAEPMLKEADEEMKKYEREKRLRPRYDH